MAFNTSCFYFNGYKPCEKNKDCTQYCQFSFVPQKQIIIIHLGAMGAVLRSTSLLQSIHKKYPQSAVTWITDAPSDALLKNNPLIHRVVKNNYHEILALKNIQFDVGFVIDKSQVAVALLKELKVTEHFGFDCDSKNGAIIPANPEAEELWKIGLSNQVKFFENKKTENQLVHEALNLGSYGKDKYSYEMTDLEKNQMFLRRSLWLKNSTDHFIVGINTGASPVIPYKKLSIEGHQKLVEKLLSISNIKIILLGGPDDEARNSLIAQPFQDQVILSPTQDGLRDGMISVAACDIVFSGDSLGMHMAIALEKFVIAWFGPTCSHEIELYGRGVKVTSQISCSPCWKRSCHKEKMCYDHVSLDQITMSVLKGIEYCKNRSLLFKQPLLEISS